MDGSAKRWAAKRETALAIEIIQGKTMVVEASRSFDLSFSEIKAIIEHEPSFGYRIAVWPPGCNKNMVQEVFQLKGWQETTGGCVPHRGDPVWGQNAG
ncbi:hypothetical protein [Paenirhodobacter sp.]|uniref:hypothetical protein n=1 Tax=Paenirhodobacter sp. TaxID=1965326 RepID=UPI003B3C4A5F